MTELQALIIAILQGATELFPVSSLGHAVILPALLGWHIDQAGRAFLPFLVMLHLGTATALLLYFWRDWWAIGTGVLGISGAHRASESRRILLLIVIATIPAVVLGAGFEHRLRLLFGAPLLAALFLVANGLLLLFGEGLRRRMKAAPRAIATLSVVDALIIGLWQCLALIPGISRSGATIVGGLLRGVDHAGSARFSFLIATPIILGASAKELPSLMHAGVDASTWKLFIAASVLAAITAFASTAFLMRYFRGHEAWALNPFAYYCLAAGLLSGAWLMFA